jgi:RNA polymerase sigma-70 factor (ECF subfamily)
MKDEVLQDIIKGCKEGDLKSQNKFYNHYVELIRGVVSRYYLDKGTIDDLTQESFIKIFNILDNYKYKGSFEGWIKKIVNNAVIDKLRKKKITNVEYNETHESYSNNYLIGDPYDYTIDKKVKDIIEVSKGLSRSYKLVFDMYFLEEKPHKEISKLLGISEGTSKSNLHKAKNEIVKKLKNKVY